MELQDGMHTAVAEERYAEASRLKAALTQAQSADTVQQAEQVRQAPPWIWTWRRAQKQRIISHA